MRIQQRTATWLLFVALGGSVGCGSAVEQPRKGPIERTLPPTVSNTEWLYTVRAGNTNEHNRLSLWINGNPINTWSHTGKGKDYYQGSLRGHGDYKIKVEAHHEVPPGSNNWVENKYRVTDVGHSVAFETEDSTDNNFKDMVVLFQVRRIN